MIEQLNAVWVIMVKANFNVKRAVGGFHTLLAQSQNEKRGGIAGEGLNIKTVNFSRAKAQVASQLSNRSARCSSITIFSCSTKARLPRSRISLMGEFADAIAGQESLKSQPATNTLRMIHLELTTRSVRRSCCDMVNVGWQPNGWPKAR
jgi:hypothetical protein